MLIFYRHRACACIALLSVAAASLIGAEIPRLAPETQDSLEAILARIETHSANEAWKQGNFQDDVIEAWLDNLTGKVARAAAFPDLTVPVHFKDVTPGKLPAPAPAGPAAPAQRLQQVQASLIIGNDVGSKNARLQNSLILANGNVEAMSLDNCVVVARGLVSVGSSKASILVSGAYVRISMFDGQPGNNTNGSLVVSRGWADVRSAYGTMIFAPEGVTFDQSDNVALINAPVPEPEAGVPAAIAAARGAKARSLKVPDLSLERLPEHSLASRITILGFLHGEFAEPIGPLNRTRVGPRGLLFRWSEQKHVAELDAEIVDEEGRPIEQLRDWKLTSLNTRFAMFTKPGATAVLRLAKKQPPQP